MAIKQHLANLKIQPDRLLIAESYNRKVFKFRSPKLNGWLSFREHSAPFDSWKLYTRPNDNDHFDWKTEMTVFIWTLIC